MWRQLAVPIDTTLAELHQLRILLSPEPDEIEEQRNLKRWSGGTFDPERFDLAKTDQAVRGALQKRRREGA